MSTPNRKSNTTASVPAETYNLIKKWIDSKTSTYVSVDEAYRDAIRHILGKWPQTAT